MIGDVFIVDTISDAVSCARNAQGAASRFVSLDGCIASTDGKLSFVRFTEADKQNNALARRRALAQAVKDESLCRELYDAAQSEDGRVESELRQVQTASLKLSESLANLKGQSESARRDADASARALRALPMPIEWFLLASRRYLHLREKMQAQCIVSMLLVWQPIEQMGF